MSSQKNRGLSVILGPNQGKELTSMAAINLNKEQFQQMAEGGKPILVDFWAPWCGPCKMVGPIIDELAKEYEGKVIMGKCDVDENSDLPAEFGIRNIPTVLFFKNGELVDKQVGAVGKPAFVEKVEKLL